MHTRTPYISVISATIAFTCVCAYAATLTLTPGTRYQTIDGFGAHGAKNVWWSGGPFYDDAFLNLILDDLGMTIFRNEYYPDNGEKSKQLPFCRALKAAADKKGIPIKFFATYWTPPARMKDNNSTVGGGSLKPSSYNEFADYCVSTVNYYRNEVGQDLYALSIQNEPRFVEPYNSCVYTGETYRDVLKIVGAKFRSLGITTKLLGPEDMGSVAEAGAFINPTLKDTAARKYLGIFAVHCYSSDGVTPGSAGNWTALGRTRATYNLTLWQTETSGHAETWDGAMTLAQTILGGLRNANMSGWTYWNMSIYPGDNGALMYAATPGPRYYASKHFYRYIRPGAVRIQSDCDAGLDNVAFVNAAEKTLSIVLMNVTTTTQTIAVAGTSVPTSFTMYRSSSGENCVNKGVVQASSVQVPGRSIVTLVASNYTPPGVGAQAPAARRPAASSPRMNGSAYGLDGTLLSGSRRNPDAHAVVLHAVANQGRMAASIQGF